MSIDNDQSITRREFLKIALFAVPSLLLPNNLLEQGQKPLTEGEFKASHEVVDGDTSRKVILMTYDDFYISRNSPNNIDLILDAYKDLGKATFFLPGGYSRDNLSLKYIGDQVVRIVEEGHVLGCHGLIHENLAVYNDAQLRNDFETWLKMVKDFVPGYKVEWIRFPFGSRNNSLRKIAAEYGMQSVMWSFESGGEDKKTKERVIDNVKKGTIVLSHNQRYYYANDASEIVQNLISRGYSLESVATGLKPSDYYKNYLTSTKNININGDDNNGFRN